MRSAELSSTQAPQEPAADLNGLRLSSMPIVAGGYPAEFWALVRPEAVNCEVSAEPRANRGRGRAAFHAIALWLRRALAESARAWALAAGVPPDLYD